MERRSDWADACVCAGGFEQMLDVVRVAGEDGVAVCNEEREGRVRDVAATGSCEQQATASGNEGV